MILFMNIGSPTQSIHPSSSGMKPVCELTVFLVRRKMTLVFFLSARGEKRDEAKSFWLHSGNPSSSK